jgi:sulfofructose kinase
LSPTIDVLGIGLNATDTLLLVPEFPPYAGKIAFDRELLSPGGQIATAIVTCAKLGLRAKYVGTIGDDRRGQIQRESLDNSGVDTTGLIVREGCPNQTAYILIDQRTGERTVLWQRSDCLRLRPSDLRAEDIAGTRLLHIDGYDTEAAGYAASVRRSRDAIEYRFRSTSTRSIQVSTKCSSTSTIWWRVRLGRRNGPEKQIRSRPYRSCSKNTDSG